MSVGQLFAAMMPCGWASLSKDMRCDGSLCFPAASEESQSPDLIGSESKRCDDCDVLSLIFSICTLSFHTGLQADADRSCFTIYIFMISTLLQNKMTFKTFSIRTQFFMIKWCLFAYTEYMRVYVNCYYLNTTMHTIIPSRII